MKEINLAKAQFFSQKIITWTKIFNKGKQEWNQFEGGWLKDVKTKNTYQN